LAARPQIVIGTPVLPDGDLVKLLSNSLNLSGLERVTSTVLRMAIIRDVVTKSPPVNANGKV
jgi:hypothetical protein